MKKIEALDLIVETKAISPLTRNFVVWLYENGYMIVNPDELQKINSATVIADVHGMNPFTEWEPDPSGCCGADKELSFQRGRRNWNETTVHTPRWRCSKCKQFTSIYGESWQVVNGEKAQKKEK